MNGYHVGLGYISWWDVKGPFLRRWWRLKFNLKWFWGNAWAAIFFLRIAILILRDKMVWVNRETVTSRGGYKYLALYVSYWPLSGEHEYGEDTR